MDWSFVDEFDKFFSEFGDFTTFLSLAFAKLPGIFTFLLGFMLVIFIVVGGLYMILKVVG